MNESIRRLATPGVQGLRPYEPGKPIEELQREYGVSDVVKLASNENPLGPSPKAMEAVQRMLAGLARYPDGNAFTLKKALAARLGVGVECITVGNGSNDILELVTRAVVTPEHEVVFSAHAFAVYPIVTQAVGAKAVVVPAVDWGHDLEAMAAAVTPRTRVVFVANPNNPTGSWLPAEALERFVAAMPPHVLVVVDEAYYEYVAEPAYGSALRWLGRYPNLLVTRTFSKAYGLAGLRVGYGVASAEITDLLNRVRQPFNVNALALTAAEAALADTAYIEQSVTVNREGMEQLTGAFADMSLDHIPSVGNFVCVDLARPAATVYEGLLRQGVIVRPVANYGMPNHLRVTVGREEENARFITALTQVI